MSTTHKAYISAFLNSCIVGFSFMFVTIALDTVNPIDLLMYRFLIAVIGSSFPIILGMVKIEIQISDVVRILPLALFYPVLFFGFEVFGLEYTTSSEAGIILATVPIFTTVLSRLFLKEKTTMLQNVFIFLSLIGIIYIFIMNTVGSINFHAGGTFLLLLSTVTLSSYNVMARKLSQEYSYYSLVYVMTWIGCIAFVLLSLFSRLSTGESLDYITPLTHPPFLIAILYLGIPSSFITASLNNYALSKLEASRISVFSHLSTVITIFAGVFILNENLMVYHIIGITCIIIGIIGTQYFKEKKETIEP